jgi:predicted PolB exonuclease-like 3'-5' exonuclease
MSALGQKRTYAAQQVMSALHPIATAKANFRTKATLHEICKVMGMSGKPVGMHGGEVARYCLEGRIKEVAEYCETDIVNTYRVWLRYELFRGRLTHAGYAASETNLVEYIRSRSNTKPHLIDLTQ